MKDYILIRVYKKNVQNRLLVIGLLKKFFGFKLFFYINLKKMNIEMIEFTENHLIPKDGKYLVKTTGTHRGTIQYLQATCKLTQTAKGMVTSIDVSNQRVTHISKQPLL